MKTQEVLDAVWPGTFVGDAVLKGTIRQLREALEDSAETPSYIETAHRRGYRFIGELSEPAPDKDTERIAAAIHLAPTLIDSRQRSFHRRPQSECWAAKGNWPNCMAAWTVFCRASVRLSSSPEKPA